MKRILVAIVLVVVLTVSLLSGCGGEQKVVYNPDNFIADTSNPQIVKEPVTINFFVPKHSLHIDYKDMAVFKELSRITNINLKFTQVDWEAYSEKRQFQWEDLSTLPDAFMFCNNMTEQVLYSQMKAVAPLNGLIDEFCPNYKNLMSTYPEISRVSTLDDGNMYSFTCVDNEGSTCYQYVNDTWLKDLYNDGYIDFRMPTTLDEFKEMLYAFKNHDPNHNGIADEIPLCSKFDNTSLFLLSAFGHVTKSIEITDEGKFIFVPQTDAYKNYLKLAKELYDEKLMNQNIYEITDGDVASYGNQNKVGCSEGVAAFLLVGDELADDYKTIPPLVSDYSPVDENGNKVKTHLCFSMFDPTALMITEQTPYKREIARLIDYLYSPEGVKLYSSGIEGNHWDYDNESKESWHFNFPENVDAETFRATITPNVGLGAAFYKDKDWLTKQTNELKLQLIEDASVYRDYFKVAVPDLIFSSEQQEELDFIKLALDSYVKTTEADFIMGRKDIDEYWQTYQNTISKMNVAEMIKIYETAYAKYMKK